MSSFGTIILLCSLLANPLFTSGQSPAAVLDTTGRALKAGTQYYILPTGTSNGGGATLINRGSCPLFVGLDNNVGTTGLSVIFTPFHTGETTIRESRDFRVRFTGATTCVQSTQWGLETEPSSSERTLISTRSGNNTAVHFRIEKDGSSYKMVWCPSNVCPLCKFRCGDLGIYIENGKRLLSLYDPALPVVFRRA
ncbi:hypothetical protein ACHQM5_024401 [Ranunculus cassubicifolius]